MNIWVRCSKCKHNEFSLFVDVKDHEDIGDAKSLIASCKCCGTRTRLVFTDKGLTQEDILK